MDCKIAPILRKVEKFSFLKIELKSQDKYFSLLEKVTEP